MAGNVDVQDGEGSFGLTRQKLMMKASKLILNMKLNFTGQENHNFSEFVYRLSIVRNCSGLTDDEILEIAPFASRPAAAATLQAILRTMMKMADDNARQAGDVLEDLKDPLRCELMMKAAKLFLKMELSFSGTPNENPEDFLQRADIVRNCSGLTDQEFLQVLPITLTGAAMDWFQSSPWLTNTSGRHQKRQPHPAGQHHRLIINRINQYQENTHRESTADPHRSKLIMKTALWILNMKLHFSGIRNENAGHFLTRLKPVKTCSGLTATEFLKVIPFALKKHAAVWFQLNSPQMIGYDDFLGRFCRKYAVTNDSE